jgi:hypothetical protein
MGGPGSGRKKGSGGKTKNAWKKIPGSNSRYRNYIPSKKSIAERDKARAEFRTAWNKQKGVTKI